MTMLRARLITLSVLLCLTSASALAAESLDALVNRANEAANQDNYPVAIQLYEQAVQKAPAETTLKNNLAVLYANYGVSLQEQKKYDQAIVTLDKALALMGANAPNRKNVIQAKAGTYFSQAIDLRDNSPNAAPADFQRMRDLMNAAIQLDPQETNFKKGLASIYLAEGYQLAIQEKYADAVPVFEQGLAADPQNASLKQSLANVYLGLAKEQPAQRQVWIDKALAVDGSPRVKQTADQLLTLDENGNPKDPKQDGGFAAAPDEAKAGKVRGLSTLSVSDMVRDMEAQLQITPPKSATLLQRVEALEKQVLGKPQDGALAARAKHVYTALMGSYDGLLANSNPALAQAPVVSSENSYLEEIFKVTDGKVIRWGKFPLRVYIETPKDNVLYKEDYKEAVLHGLNAWKVKTDGFVNYVEIKNPDAADIVVDWTEEYIDRFADPENVPTVYKTYSPPKKTRLMNVVQIASMLTPGYFSLAPQAIGAAMQYQQYKKLEVIREESKIKLGLAPTKDLPPDAAKQLIQNMAAKEFGHALGLKGSSDKAGDLLYPELRSDIAQLPSQRDLTTLKELYNRPPNIILNVR